jgi:hypothetical protein
MSEYLTFPAYFGLKAKQTVTKSNFSGAKGRILAAKRNLRILEFFPERFCALPGHAE